MQPVPGLAAIYRRQAEALRRSVDDVRRDDPAAAERLLEDAKYYEEKAAQTSGQSLTVSRVSPARQGA